MEMVKKNITNDHNEQTKQTNKHPLNGVIIILVVPLFFRLLLLQNVNEQQKKN